MAAVARALPRWLWWGVGAALVLLAALPLSAWLGGHDPGPLWAPHVEAWVLGLVVVVVVGILGGRLACRLLPTGFPWPDVNGPALAAVLAAGLTALSAWVMHSVFAGNPHLVDEMAQLFHARVFAGGRLAAPVPQPADAFLITHTWITDAGWVSQYPPGQTILFAVGLLTHAEWLVNPLLGGVSAILVYVAARGLYGDRTAKAAVFLWAASAWVMFMSGTYMNHVGAVTYALVAWAALWGPRRLRLAHVVAAGLALGAATATRPLDGIAAALPVLAWLAVRREWRWLPSLALGGLPVAVAWGYINWRMYGHPLTLGYTAMYGPEHGLGFHTDPWGLPFTPLIALSNAAAAVRRLNIYLFEWPLPALLPLILWAVFARHRHVGDIVVAIGILAAPLLYFFYWHSGFYPGPRFYYAAAPMLVIATARAWRWGWTVARRKRSNHVRWDVTLATAAVVAFVWGWVTLLPARWDIYRSGLSSLKHHPERLLKQRGVSQALVIIPESWGSRIVTGLWRLGAPPGLVEIAYRRLDSCDLYQFGESARRSGLGRRAIIDSLEHLIETRQPAPLVPDWPDWTLRLAPRDSIPEDCRLEMERDLGGFTLYGNHAWRNALTLDTGIVFARDLYERNEELFARYPGWEVWRFAPRGGPDAPPELEQIRPRNRAAIGP